MLYTLGVLKHFFSRHPYLISSSHTPPGPATDALLLVETANRPVLSIKPGFSQTPNSLFECFFFLPPRRGKRIEHLWKHSGLSKGPDYFILKVVCSFERLTLDFGLDHDHRVMRSSSVLGSAEHGACFSLSLPLPLPSPHGSCSFKKSPMFLENRIFCIAVSTLSYQY